jgi:hypothetical protein
MQRAASPLVARSITSPYALLLLWLLLLWLRWCNRAAWCQLDLQAPA